jgi:ferredoxin-NADP reductase
MKAIRTVTTEVRSIEAAGDDIVLLELADPDNWELPPSRGGHHIDLHLPNGLVRSYSLCGDPAEATRYRVAIKREDAGRGGSVAAHALAPGDIVPVSLPRGTFRLAAHAREHVFIAGGIGMTPFVAMIAELGVQGASCELHVLHRGAPPLAALCEEAVARASATYHRTGDGRARPDLRALVGDFRDGRHVYCCGPESLMDAVLALTAHWPEGHAHVEHFVPPPRAVDPDAKPYQAVLSVSKKVVDVAPGASLLHALHEAGVEVDAACEGGICGACRVRWTDGQPLHHDRVLTDAEREREVIACVSGCASSRLVLEL